MIAPKRKILKKDIDFLFPCDIIKSSKERRKTMEESMMRELVFIQDNLRHLIPLDLWQKWATVNEEVCEYLEKKKEIRLYGLERKN